MQDLRLGDGPKPKMGETVVVSYPFFEGMLSRFYLGFHFSCTKWESYIQIRCLFEIRFNLYQWICLLYENL